MLDLPKTSLPSDELSGSERSRSPAGVLARRFVELLLDDAGGNASASQPPEDLDPFPGLDECTYVDPAPTDEDQEKGPVRLTVEEAASAVLLGSVFETEPDVLRGLRREAPIVVIEIPSELEETITKTLSVCVFGRATTVHVSSRYRSYSTKSDRRSAIVLSCPVPKGERELLEERSLEALSMAVPICVLTDNARSSIPAALRDGVDHTLHLPVFTPPLLELLIEAVTGTVVVVPHESWISRLTVADLRGAVSEQRGAAASLDRLKLIAIRRFASSDALPRLEDMSGYGEARTIGLAMIEDLKAYRAGRIGWSEIERGLLLDGPPGVGKTLFARVLAAETGLPLVVASLAQWQAAGTGHLGDCLKAMSASVREAKRLAPSILFVDELDSFGDRASFDSRHKDYSIQVVNAFLEQLDGAVDRTGVIVLGATNDARRIDPAIIRPGRIDRVARIRLPTPTELVGILRTCLGDTLRTEDLMPAALAGVGGSGADAAGWVRRARGTARRSGRDLTVDDLLEAIRNGRAGLPADVRDRCAVHEAGHACSALALGVGDVEALALFDGGGSALVKLDVGAFTRERAFRHIVHALAGRAAEISSTGSPSAGAGGAEESDLAYATGIALGIEGSWGLGEAGPVFLGDPSVLRGPGIPLQVCLPAAMRIVRQAEAEAERLVRENRTAIRRCADALVAAGYMEADEVVAALGPVPRFEIRSSPIDLPKTVRADRNPATPT